MFKKTLIAAAIATVAAAPAAMADVSVSGQVKVGFTSTDSTATTNAKDWAPSTDNNITFKATEDLGNGMTAAAMIGLDTDNGGTGADEKDAKVSLSGGFGTVVIGRMETLTQGAVSTKMDDGGGNGALESDLTNLGRYAAVAYVSPTVNGFHVAIAGTGNGDDVTTTDNDGDGLFQHTDVVLAYANGPLSITAARADVDAADNSTANYKVTTLAASYAVGDMKVSVMDVDKDFDDASTDLGDTIYRLDYKMGNNSILLGHRSNDAGTGNTDNDVTSVKLTHSLSKRTAVWVGHRDKDSGADQTHFGILTKF